MTPSPPPADAPAPDWSSLIDHWADLSNAWFQELSTRAKANSAKVQDGSYDRDVWLDDISWFVQTLADNTASTAKACNDLIPKQ